MPSRYSTEVLSCLLEDIFCPIPLCVRASTCDLRPVSTNSCCRRLSTSPSATLQKPILCTSCDAYLPLFLVVDTVLPSETRADATSSLAEGAGLHCTSRPRPKIYLREAKPPPSDPRPNDPDPPPRKRTGRRETNGPQTQIADASCRFGHC